jgi:LacI family transcriptional regulator
LGEETLAREFEFCNVSEKIISRFKMLRRTMTISDFCGLESIQKTASLKAMNLETEKRPTLRTLAEITGLGVSTVSQALRDSPEIAVETRKRVQLAAQQAGYRPNRAGVRLRTGKTNVIAVVLNAQDEGSGFVADFVMGISRGLENSGYHLVITPYDLSDPMGPVRYIVETASADGIIISRTQPDDPRVRYLTDMRMPFATHGRTDMGIEHPYHDYDNEAFAYEALRLLAERKRKRVALISPPPALNYYRHTLAGFAKGLRDFGLESFELGDCDSDSPLTTLREIGRNIGAQKQYPDGVISAATASVFAFTLGLNDAGLKIAKDYDVVCKHQSDLLAMANPHMISVPENFRDAGRDLAQLLMQSIEGAPIASLQHIVGPN